MLFAVVRLALLDITPSLLERGQLLSLPISLQTSVLDGKENGR